jgi:hypothetical protein
MMDRIRVGSGALAALTVALAGCSNGKAAIRDSAVATAATTATPTTATAGGEVAADTSFGPSNTMGRIPVLEYHVIGSPEGQYTVTREPCSRSSSRRSRRLGAPHGW